MQNNECVLIFTPTKQYFLSLCAFYYIFLTLLFVCPFFLYFLPFNFLSALGCVRKSELRPVNLDGKKILCNRSAGSNLHTFSLHFAFCLRSRFTIAGRQYINQIKLYYNEFKKITLQLHFVNKLFKLDTFSVNIYVLYYIITRIL